VALAAPTDREKSQMYIQRYVPHLPSAGEVVIFDRSWYNRAGVERVMGFCTEAEAKHFLSLAPHVEKSMVDSGIVLFKYWLEVSPEEQEKRLRERVDDGRKLWKLSDLDIKSFTRWDEYTRAQRHVTGDRYLVGALVRRAIRRQEAGPAQHYRTSHRQHSL
jgi:polyphosphate kinase 2 (PPK2 family)